MKCFVCGKDTIGNIHHVKMQAFGGGDEASNLKPLCPTHHEMVHRVAEALPKNPFKAEDIVSREFMPYSTPYLAVLGLAREAVQSAQDPKGKKEQDIKITIPVNLHVKLKDRAKTCGVSMQHYVADLLRRDLC